MIEFRETKIERPSIESLFHKVERLEGISLFSSNSGDDREYTGLNPVIILTEKERRDGEKRTEIHDPLEELDHLVQNYSGLPEEVSLLGYISYDFKDRLEETGLYDKRTQGIYPDFYFVLFEHYIISNRSSDKAKQITLEFPFPIESHFLNWEIELPSTSGKGSIRPTQYKGTSLGKTGFERAVDKTIEYVRQGEIYQANITRAVYGETEQSVLQSALNLYRSNRITYGVFASISGGQVISTSPELFFRTEKGRITASPIKGTIPRGTSREEDEKNREELLHSEKNLAELAMIVDLLRNDLSRVCYPGTVNVPEFPVLMTLDNVYHLYADVKGKLLPESGIGKILKRTFPGGSITGCPKIRACQIIDKLEPVPRGIYTGSFGRIGFNGDSVFNIMIRSVFRKGSEVIYNIGGGITLLSNPEEEFEETIHKGRNIQLAIKMEEQ